MMMTQLLIGCFMIGLTVVIHAVALDRLVALLEKLGPVSFQHFKKYWEIPLMVTTVLGVFLTHVVQIWLWAILFLYLEPHILPNLESALYFSTSAFTTVGFGDVFLDEKWRLLSSFESANGFILFGWSTAFIFEIISKLYKDDHIRKTK
ncbi:MAG: two pore domain potassium channel family protein [Alphaproteobacteria bacterium]|nr:two pore domain potassium channel family protein [Alphaproteobacteria bacterium]